MFDYYKINTVGLPKCTLKFIQSRLVTIYDFIYFYSQGNFCLTTAGQINYLIRSNYLPHFHHIKNSRKTFLNCHIVRSINVLLGNKLNLIRNK